jgi:hypothetical protein
MYRRLLWPLVAVTLVGCQTATLDPNFALQMESYRLTITSQQAVEVAKARAEEARYTAMAAIADRADPQSKQMAILALALARGGSDAVVKTASLNLPIIPETQEDRALKWAAIFAGPVMSVAQGYFGYRLGVQQSNNTANSTIASYNALGTTATAGFNSNASIAGSGFGAVQNVANAGFGTIGNLSSAFTRPNITLTATNGVIGSGSYTGPYSGANSGNSGRINSDDNQRNCNPVAGNAGPPAPPGTTPGAGGSVTLGPC